MQPLIWPKIFSFAATLWLCATIGCNPPPRPGLTEISAANTAKNDEPSPGSTIAIDEVGEEISFSTISLPWETWHSYFMGGKKIGYIHALSAIDNERGDQNVRTIVMDQLMLRRGSTTLVQSLRQTSIEDSSGSLISFDAELHVGPTRTSFEGRVVVDALAVTTISGKTSQVETIPWSERYRSIAAAQQTLLAKPIQLNEIRRVPYIVPMTYRLGMIEMKCVNRAAISTMDGVAHNALEINVHSTLGDAAGIESTFWADEKGNLLKSYTPALDLTAIRCNQTAALKSIDTPADVFSVMAVAVKGSLTQPQQAYRAGYLLKFSSAPDKPTAGPALQPQIGQWFRKVNGETIQLLVTRDPMEVNRPGFTGLTLVPEPADSESGPIIDSASIDVRKLAGLSKATVPRELALDLARTVKQLIGAGDFTRGFATASQTARDSVGDCTERAVLLAAMLRARQIPARVVAGLVYAGAVEKPVMAYHMWTIAWIDDRWISLDPTSGGLAPADRIAFVNSNLADGNQYAFLTGILNLAGQLEIEIANAKYQPLE